MNPRYDVLLPAVLALTTTNALGQPELTADNTFGPSVGQELTRMQYILPDPASFSMVTESGENQTWDLSGHVFDNPVVWEGRFMEPPFDGLPGAAFVLTFSFAATHAFVYDDIAPEDDTYSVEFVQYHELGIDYFGSFGNAVSSDPDGDGVYEQLFTQFVPGVIEFHFQIRYGTEFGATHTEVTTTPESSFRVQGTTYDRFTKVVGWGTLVTPFGSVDALQFDQSYTHSVELVEIGSGRRIRFMAPVQELAGKTSAATAWVQASFELDPDENVTDAVFTILQVGGGGNPTSAENLSEVLETFRLDQNYPNPFNPSTTIPFALDSPGHVELTIHDYWPGKSHKSPIGRWQRVSTVSRGMPQAPPVASTGQGCRSMVTS